MNEQFERDLAAKIDGKTKPLGSLGRVEQLAAQLARIQGTLEPRARDCALILFAGDHGIAAAGVSAFPQEVTRQMVANFLAGGAAANVFADTFGVPVTIVDAGVAGEPMEHPDLVQARIGAGTRNALENAAMTRGQYDLAVKRGERLGAQQTADVLCFGEMGIGNTSAASLVAAKVLGASVADLTGRGTGLDDDALAHKRQILQQAAARTADCLTPEEALCEYGGFEIAMMTGAMIGAAEHRRVVLVDGFIASVAALCARTLVPAAAAGQVFAHRSAEAGHQRVLEAMQAQPLLDLEMRLGEGSGALLAWPLVQAAAAFLTEMASFESAGVSGKT